MTPYLKSKILKIIYAVLGVSMVIPAIMGWMWIILEEFLLDAFLTALISTIVMIICYTLLFLEDAGVKLKNIFTYKKRDALIKESLTKFNTTNKEFIDTFIKNKKKYYKTNGDIYYRDTDSAWIYKEKGAIEKSRKLYSSLYDSILSKGGFVEFLHSVYTMDFDSGWQAHSYMELDIVSCELKYLLGEVFLITDFCIEDNLISEKYTKENNETIEKLNTIYSPILLVFEEEVKSILDKLNTAKSHKKSK